MVKGGGVFHRESAARFFFFKHMSEDADGKLGKSGNGSNRIFRAFTLSRKTDFRVHRIPLDHLIVKPFEIKRQ